MDLPRREPEHPYQVLPAVDTQSLLFTASIADIDNDITFLQNLSTLFPRSHVCHILGVNGLACARFLRYDLSGQKEDIDECIVHLTEAILLPPISVANFHVNIVKLFFTLTLTLLNRSMNTNNPTPWKVASRLLIQMLCLQFHLGAKDATRNMEEIVVLCHELSASDTSTTLPVETFSALFVPICTELFRGRNFQLVDEVIACLRDTVKVCPLHIHHIYLVLAHALSARFVATHSGGDYDEARMLFENVINANHPEENPNSDQVQALIGVIGLATSRVPYFDSPEHFEETLSRCRSMLRSAYLPEHSRSLITRVLAVFAYFRFQRYGLSDGLQEENSIESELVKVVSSQGPAAFENHFDFDAVRETYSKTAIEQKIQDLKDLVSETSPRTLRHSESLDRLAMWYKTKFSLTDDITDLEESIVYHRLLLDVPDFNVSRPIYLNQLCGILLFAFGRTNKIDYLDELIALDRDLLKLKGAEAFHFYAIFRLVLSLLMRFPLSHQIEDLNEVIRLMPSAVDDQHKRAPDRFQLSSIWAYIARHMGHPTVSEAYKKTMVLMRDSLSFSPTVPNQHNRLAATDDLSKTIPLDYASYQVDLGQLEAAIETLEQGRALLWSEMRSLRTPKAESIGEDMPLAKKLVEINQELEMVTTSVTPSRRLDIESDGTRDGDGMDAFGHLVLKQRRLLEEHDALIFQVQGRPGFERFWKTPSFATLQSAASHGPVIIINHCKWRSDILILLSDAPPSLIPTHEDFFDRASKLRDNLLGVRNNQGHGLDSPEYELTLGYVLSELYELVGKPVIRRLRELGIPEQSRIWWCPTSVFCSLPLHAMGPIPSTDDVDVKQYISDLYICSYTPTLFALIESRGRNSDVSDRPSLLLVAQPNTSLPNAGAEIEVVQAVPAQVTSLISEDATSLAVVDGLRSHQLVHFTCHGTLEGGKPFDASFALHGNDRLTLLEIIRSRLPSAEFAFLAACHTAELTDESIADEGLHLVAAMQYCGFRSVVGTMWAMADIDGPVLAKHFYKAMFSKKMKGIPYCERSAEALRDAVQKLRRKRKISLERWVNFVHFGA
ncbi:CHAT domain-containing protein [Lactarius indigo]|nr:CHAT domain-containing protein [Lactarius indigo]